MVREQDYFLGNVFPPNSKITYITPLARMFRFLKRNPYGAPSLFVLVCNTPSP